MEGINEPFGDLLPDYHYVGLSILLSILGWLTLEDV